MSAGFQQVTDLYDIYNVVQNTMLRYPVDTTIASLKEYFAKDAKYHYVADQWGFAKVKDHTGTKPTDGLFDNLITRIFIGEHNKLEVIQYPSLLVKADGFKSVPISLNMDTFQVQNRQVALETDSGYRKFLIIPDCYVMNGAWDGTLTIEVLAEDPRTRDDLTELVAIFIQNLNWNSFYRAGIAINPTSINISGTSDSENRNSKIFKRTVSFNVRGEWRREVPISNLIKSITFCVDFGAITNDANYEIIAPNLEINSELSLEQFVVEEEVVTSY